MLSETSYRNQPRRRFSREFKRDVVELLQEEAATVAEIAREYDLHPNQMMRWRTEYLRGAYGAVQNIAQVGPALLPVEVIDAAQAGAVASHVVETDKRLVPEPSKRCKRCIYPIIPRQPDSWLNPGHGYSTATRPQFHRLFLPAAGVPARSAATRRVRDHWPLPSAATSTTPHWHAPRRGCH